MSNNFQNLISPWVHCTSITNFIFSSLDRLLRFITTVWDKTSKILFLRQFSAQVSQMVFSAPLTVLRLIYNCKSWNFKNLISPWVQCRSIRNRVFSSLDHFTAFHNIISFNSKNVITLRAQCTNIPNRVFSSFERFTAFYNCMSYNFKNLISPWIQCTGMTNRVFSLFDRFTASYNFMR